MAGRCWDAGRGAGGFGRAGGRALAPSTFDSSGRKIIWRWRQRRGRGAQRRRAAGPEQSSRARVKRRRPEQRDGGANRGVRGGLRGAVRESPVPRVPVLRKPRPGGDRRREGEEGARRLTGRREAWEVCVVGEGICEGLAGRGARARTTSGPSGPLPSRAGATAVADRRRGWGHGGGAFPSLAAPRQRGSRPRNNPLREGESRGRCAPLGAAGAARAQPAPAGGRR